MDNLVNIISTKISTSKNSNLLQFLDLFKNIKIYDWEKYKPKFPNKNNKNYYKHVIYLDDNYELILIKWDENSTTSNHRHPKNGCIMKLLDGELNEDRFNNNKIYKKNNLKINDVGYMHDDLGTHKIYALKESYSLHLYSPPNYYSN